MIFLILFCVLLCIYYLATNKKRVIAEEIMQILRSGDNNLQSVVSKLRSKYEVSDIMKAFKMLQDQGVIGFNSKEGDDEK